MGVMKVTDSDGTVGYIETNVDLASTSPTAPARMVQNRELMMSGALLSSNNPLIVSIANWNAGAPVQGPGTSTTLAATMFADTSGHNIANSALLFDSVTKLLADVGFVGTLQPSPAAPVTLTSSQNDYGPVVGMILDVNPSTQSINLTGFAGGQNGRFLIVRNVGTAGYTVTLANLTSSQAVNQINSPAGSLALAQGSAALLMYDGNVTNWRILTYNASSTDATYSRNATFSRYFAMGTNVATISAATNNYAQSNSPYWQFSSSATYAISGMANTFSGSIRFLENTGTYPFTLNNLNANSTAANQFTFVDAADTILPAGQRQGFYYDATATKWKPLGPHRYNLGNYTVANLPVLVAAGKGFTAFATNGRKSGEAAGNGTGVPVYYDGTTWRTFSADAAVVA